MSKKTYATLGMILGLIMALSGILTITGAMGGDTSYPSSAPYSYESGYASFGADFYTYVSNNSAEAASAARTTASNLEDIAELLKNVCGAFLIGFGLMGFCFFGTIRAGCTVPAAEPVTPCSAPPSFRNYNNETEIESAVESFVFPENTED